MRTTTQTTPKANFLRALEGARNEQFRRTFATFLERSDDLRHHDDCCWRFSCGMSDAELDAASALAKWDKNVHCAALSGSDRHKFICFDVTAVIEKLRIN